jgi:hypothetical protein
LHTRHSECTRKSFHRILCTPGIETTETRSFTRVQSIIRPATSPLRFDVALRSSLIDVYETMPVRRQRTQLVVIDEPFDDVTTAVPASTRWHRKNGRSTRRDKAAKEQYLSPQEEKGLANYVLRMCQNGYPLPVKALRSLALVIRQKRGGTSEKAMKPPGKNWPQGFYNRNPQLKARRLRAMPWDRHDHTIYSKVNEWFSIIGKQLVDPAIRAENVYNMDETGVLLGKLGSPESPGR